jgi:YesN/AraC family two-component response regulator
MLQIDQLMKEQELFRRIGLKLQDVADQLNSNRTYVTDCIKSARGMTFTQYVNTYRVNYAKEQLLNQPDKKVSAIATDAGFTNEVSFFRAFKALTGTTPSEFRAKKD